MAAMEKTGKVWAGRMRAVTGQEKDRARALKGQAAGIWEEKRTAQTILTG